MVNSSDYVVSGLRIPYSLVSSELNGLYGSRVLAEFREIIEYYNIYEKGAQFNHDSSLDYIPADLRFKESRKLINKEARFLFSKHPDFWVSVPYDKNVDDQATKDLAREQTTILQSYVDRVLDATNLFSKLPKAAKDCFIGKRVAYFVNFNEDTQRILIDFIPSLEFVFETDPEDTSRLTKIVAFYTVTENDNKAEQRIYKKKYWLENGYCWINEALYNGLGDLIEELIPDRKTRFTHIPAGVIINDGLTGDLDGVSEIEELADSESWYSRISNNDMDSERKGMNPIIWARDMSPVSTAGLSIAPGAFWDLSSDQDSAYEGQTGEVGILEPSLNYTNAVDATLSRIRSSMYEALDIPDVSPDALKGVVSSGKTLKAIYWGLIVRCDEKMLAWRPALKHIVELIIEGGKLYPKSASAYTSEPLPDVAYEITVENQYPLPDDEADEKAIDLSEVNAQTMSRLAYMKKWRNLTDAEAVQELRQIALEREMLEDSYSNPMEDNETVEVLE